jgi:hypothetical protein
VNRKVVTGQDVYDNQFSRDFEQRFRVAVDNSMLYYGRQSIGALIREKLDPLAPFTTQSRETFSCTPRKLGKTSPWSICRSNLGHVIVGYVVRSMLTEKKNQHWHGGVYVARCSDGQLRCFATRGLLLRRVEALRLMADWEALGYGSKLVRIVRRYDAKRKS